MMKAVILRRAGGPENFELCELERPSPGPCDVLVRVRACGVAHRDLIERAGGHPAMRFPIVQGHELAGEVVEVGEDIRTWAPGDRVIGLYADSCGRCTECLGGDDRRCSGETEWYGRTVNGGYAEYVRMRERALQRLPDAIEFPVAATLMSALGAGYNNVVHRAAVRPGENVIVTGATGGVGLGALQAARVAGARVWAVTSSADKEGRLRGLGADEVLVDDGRGFHKRVRARLPQGVDAVIDCVGEPTFNASLRAVRNGGRVVIIGNIGTTPYRLNLGLLVLNGISILGSDNVTRRALGELMDHVAARRITPVIDRLLPLSQVADAHRAIERREVFGRVVLQP